jgi:hypothetical protein
MAEAAHHAMLLGSILVSSDPALGSPCADALVAGVENLAVPLYAEAVRFIDDAIAGSAPAANLPLTADSEANATAGAGT